MFATFARVEEEEEALPRRCRDIEYLVKNTKNSPVSSRAKEYTHIKIIIIITTTTQSTYDFGNEEGEPRSTANQPQNSHRLSLRPMARAL